MDKDKSDIENKKRDMMLMFFGLRIGIIGSFVSSLSIYFFSEVFNSQSFLSKINYFYYFILTLLFLRFIFILFDIFEEKFESILDGRSGINQKNILKEILLRTFFLNYPILLYKNLTLFLKNIKNKKTK